MHKKQFKHVENIFDHHLQVKRKLKKIGATLTQKIQKCNQSSSNYMLLLARQTLHRKPIKRNKIYWLQTRNLFPFFMALKGDRSKSIYKKVRRQSLTCQRPCKGTRRNIKGCQMHTYYIKVYHEINVTVVQKHELKNCLNMQVATLRIKMSNLFNGLRPFFDSLRYIKRLRDEFISLPFKW